MKVESNTDENEIYKNSYNFVKEFYKLFLLYHEQHEDISHNTLFFLYCEANAIIGSNLGEKPNGADIDNMAERRLKFSKGY